MNFSLAFSEAALAYLATIPAKIRGQVIRKARALALDPKPHSSKLLKEIMLNDGEGVYRERSGDYRILYLIRSKPNRVIILDIGNRKTIYKKPNLDPHPET